MYVKNNLLSFVSKCVIVISSICGVALISGWTEGEISPFIFCYYTIQSNLLVFFIFAVIAVRSVVFLLQKRRCELAGETAVVNPVFFPRFKGAVTLAITVTFLVYHFMLSGSNFAMNGTISLYRVGNLLVHYLTPILVLLDWLLFDKKAAFKLSDPFLWLVIPLTYFAFALIRAQTGSLFPGTNSRYPYFFIDIDLYGAQVALYVVFLALAFLVLGYIILFIDRLLAKIHTSDTIL